MTLTYTKDEWSALDVKPAGLPMEKRDGTIVVFTPEDREAALVRNALPVIEDVPDEEWRARRVAELEAENEAEQEANKRKHRYYVPDEEDQQVAQAGLLEALDEAVEVLQRFVHFTYEEQAWAVALWAAATHQFASFSIFPRLAVRAPTRGSGKTRTLEVVKELVANGWGPLISPSAAAFYRKVEKTHPTALLDEVDRLFEKRAEDSAALVEVINAGHAKGATVPRVVPSGKDFLVHDFDVFAPLALAGIAANWPDTVLDRSIIVTLERKTSEEKVERYRFRHHGIPAAVGERFAQVMVDIIFEDDVPLPEDLSDRAQDNWEPLFLTAVAAGGHWPERARLAADRLGNAAAAIMAADERDEVLVLGDMVTIFEEEEETSASRNFIHSKDMVNRLNALDDGRWADYRGNGLTVQRLASLLKVLQVRPEKPYGAGEKRGYDRSKVEAVWNRVTTARTTT